MDIRTEGLTKTFQAKDNKETVAVDKLTVTIPGGHLVGLLGPSGCGKSTTLFMLAGLHEPTSGRIFFGDEDVTDLPPEKRGIGLVFQNYALYPHMTVFDNIAFPLRNSKRFKAEHPNASERKEKIADAVMQAAKIVAIEELLERRPAQLSGGQQQRVAIARAIAKKPKVLLLDEPLSNLDARLRIQTREEIRRIQQATGITTVFVTHDQEEAMSITDEIIVMKEGVVQQVGHPQATYEKPANIFVASFLGNPPINITSVEVASGRAVINGSPCVAAALPDGRYSVGVRPESFQVAPEGAENSFPAKVTNVATIGRDFQVRFDFNGRVAEALIDAEEGVREGDLLHLTTRRSGTHFFGPDGARVEAW